MIEETFKALGGLGLFLVGMKMLTEGLRGLAGLRLRRMLRGSTETPFRGAVAGALATAMVQSSSATTVASVGFVAAGLMTFPQALGIIFGANIGTTLTGWLVAIVGFKLDLGLMLMPFVLAGVLGSMFAPARWKPVGWALAGFGILFIGIESLKDGMGAFGGIITPETFPPDTLVGRLKLVLIGVALTVITQSSSAGVASALAALSVGTITFPQAAAMVIGMDIGTTFSAMIAALGGSTAARRTGFSHVIYNVLTGIMAFGLLYPLGWLMHAPVAAWLGADPQIALVAFHSFFNVLGVVAVLGITDRFARLVMWLIPERSGDLARRLDRSLLGDPRAAMDAVTAAVRDITGYLFDRIADRLAGRSDEILLSDLEDARDATAQARAFVQDVRAQAASHWQNDQLRVMHVLDHVDRLRFRAMQAERIGAVVGEAAMRVKAADLARLMADFPAGPAGGEYAARADAMQGDMHDFREVHRNQMIREVAQGQAEAEGLTLRLDASRWLQRCSYHVWRIAENFRLIDAPEPPGGTSTNDPTRGAPVENDKPPGEAAGVVK